MAAIDKYFKRMTQPVTSRFGIERYIRKAERTPPEVLATPSLDDIAYDYSSDKAEQATKETSQIEEMALKRKELSEKVREADINARFTNEQMALWRKQNTLATLIGAGTTAVAGLGGFAALERDKTRDITQQRILATQQETMRGQTEAISKARQEQQDFYRKLLEQYFHSGVGDASQRHW